MNNAKFTTGPWRFTVIANRAYIESVESYQVCDISNMSDMRLSNVHLITTSPDLYQQLEESNDCMLALEDTLWECGYNITALKEQIKRNEFVLAKARGE
jgi:hypothetical protein